MTWQEVIDHPSLQDLPFKIELNADGVIEMRPITNTRGQLMAELSVALPAHLSHGKVSLSSGIQTIDGLRVADVVWMTTSFFQDNRHKTYLRAAPSICIEIISPSYTDAAIQYKTELFLEAGATEVWTCDLEGQLSFYGAGGQLKQSQLAPSFPQRIVL